MSITSQQFTVAQTSLSLDECALPAVKYMVSPIHVSAPLRAIPVNNKKKMNPANG